MKDRDMSKAVATTIQLPHTLDSVVEFLAKADRKTVLAIQEKTSQRLMDLDADWDNKFDQFLAENGRSKDDVVPVKGRKASGTHPVRFRDPENPANVWKAIGSPPTWLRDKAKQTDTWKNAAACNWACENGYLVSGQDAWATSKGYLSADNDQQKAA